MELDSGRGAWSFFNLPVPQYTAVTETIISDLAWSITLQQKAPETVLERRANGIVYERTNAGSRVTSSDSRSNGEIVETIPREGDSRWSDLGQSLRENIDVSRDSLQATISIFLENLTAHVPAQAKSKAAIPFNAHTALMQNGKGLAGGATPPNYAHMTRQMYALGGGNNDAAALLADAFKHIESAHDNDWITQATSLLTPDELKPQVASIFEAKDDGQPLLLQPAWLKNQLTPFHWFASAWESVMSPKLIDRMPRRRWIDWSSCVLRTGMGAGYIFELNFYYQLLCGLTNQEEAQSVADKALGKHRGFFQWNSYASVSSRDCVSKIAKLCERGTSCRQLIREQENSEDPAPKPSDYHAEPDGLKRWVEDARLWAKGSVDLEEQIRAAVSGVTNRSANNAQEAIKYALLDRSADGREGDTYAMLKKRGNRYTVMQPGKEWLVVLSSLEAERRGSHTVRLADITESFEQLGVTWDFKTLIRELEVLGLALSSSDADDAIEVQRAF